MSFLEQLLGGGQQRQEYQDFVNRYEQGAPWEGISQQEAMSRYQQVAPQLPPQEYEQAAQETFARMTPDQRRQLAQMLQQQARQQQVNFPDLNQDGIDDRLQDPRAFAQVTSRMEQQQPGLLGQLLGGGGGRASSGGSPTSGGVDDLIGNPLAKAALAGIAAMAAQRFLSGQGRQ